MARSISNKISISCIDDGTTIHGALRCDDPLSQGYDKKSKTCTPDWTNSGPLIYLTLLNGDTVTTPTGEVEWYYNKTKLSFDGTGKSTAPYAGYFQKGTLSSGEFKDEPYLQIIKNLAAAGNLNDDVIEIRGNVEIGGQPVGFSSGVVIQLSELNANGYLGVIYFDGKSYMASDDDIVTCWSNLFAGSEVATGTDGWTCEWDFNGTPVTNTSSSSYPYKGQWTGTPKVNYNMLKVKGTDDGGVLDIATVTCRFYMPASSGSGKTLVYTATATIDDISDTEYMYIFFTIDNAADNTKSDGSPVSLRKGQKVNYTCYVATENDASDSAIDTSLKYFYFQPRKADGSIPATNPKPIASLGNHIKDGFYQMTTENVTGGGKKAKMSVTFDEVQAQGKNISGIIKATDAALT